MAKKLTSTKAKKILHDKTVHGKPLTDKQRKFFGAVASGAIPQAQNGIEGTMGGLTDIGFNYNGAWGGTMAMGGSLLGPTGMFYARTINPAPSNGPYAKKTKASAQFGTMLTPITGEDVSRFFDLFSVPQKAATKVVTGKYQTPSEAMNIKNPVGAFATDMILDPVNLMMGTGALKQAVKFKPTPGMMYRGLGEEGFKDAIESGVFRPKQHNYSEVRSLAERVSTPKQFGSTYYAPANKFGVIKNYGPNYIAEVPFDEASFARRYGRKDWSWSTSKQIPINEGRILKKDWLRGYKELKPPKKQNGGEMKYYQEGLDFKPKTISQDGSILTPYGQWEYPGEITTIPSNEITMQGVPYPVLGISDIGDVQMMYPGEDYTFDGESVTEYPMMQQGGRTPIYVDNPRDPRLNAYQDSLNLYKTNVSPKVLRDITKYNQYRKTNKKTSDKIQPLERYEPDLEKMEMLKNSNVIYHFAQPRVTKSNKNKYYTDKKGITRDIKTNDEIVTDIGIYKKPVQPVIYRKPEPKKQEQPKLKPIEIKQNIYEGTPVYSATVGSGGPSALVGFANQKGDTTFIKPEDYERFGVPKYGREYIEKATNKFRDGGVSVNEADAQPIKKLDQLLNFTNYNDMAKAKKGKKLPKAQFGIPSEYNLNLAQYDPKTQMFNSPTGRISMFDTTSLGFTNTGSKMGAFTNINDVNNALGDMGGIAGASTQLLGGIQTLIEEGKQRKQSKQALAISDIAAQAATSRPVGLERKYVRPEDMLVNPGETGSPYGTGYDFLQMEDGGFIGDNPTEIQNMYNPGTLYSDLGYEPLEDSNQVKQFAHGGKAQFGTTQAGQLGSTFGSFLGGGGGQQSGAGQVGSAVGGVAGNILLPGIGGPIGSALGGLVGGAIGARGQKTMEQRQGRIQANLGSAAFQQSLQGQFSAYMEHGGELKYLSRDWQPQVITKFGEYDVKDLLKAPKDADMLRAGGHLKEYTEPSERAMSTERPDFQMGGELQTYWGGYAEPISENPYLPDGGETVMFRGQSHEESDGKGRTGIGITYGNNPVEVERGEPAVKLKDGGTGENSLVVFGNMKIPSYGASELNDPKAKGMKFKRYAEDLSKIENKANKVSDKALKLIDGNSGDTPFEMLSLSTANIMMKGSDMKLKDAAMKKQLAAGIQSAILDTAEELGLENDALAKGKIKPAKGGGKFTSAQMGTALPNSYTDIMFNKFGPFNPLEEVVVQGVKPKGDGSKSKVAKAAATAAPIKRQMATLDFTPRELPADMSPIVEIDSLKTTTPGIEKLKSFKAVQPEEDKFDLLDFANMLSPFTRPL
jgi:hypothetical protein